MMAPERHLMPSCLVVEHVPPESSYAIGDALVAAGIELVVRRTYEPDPLPEGVGEFDGVVVMGGPMSAASDEGFDTRQMEIDLLANAVELGVPTLGMCLGAQLLAAACGGRVTKGTAGPEIGWGAVRLHHAGESDLLFSAFPSELRVLHWHGDTYELPRGAIGLASSTSYREQAFRVGVRAWGLQFHIEVDEVAVDAFLDAFGSEALGAGVTPQTIRDETASALQALLPHRNEFLRRFAALVTTRAQSTSPRSSVS